MKFLHQTAFIIFLLFSAYSYSQENGFIRGKVYDETGLTLPGARVMIVGQTLGAKSDLDGNFSISVPPGTYDITISSLAKDTLKVTDIEVSAGEVSLVPNIVLYEKSITTGTVVVTAERRDNTDNAVLTLNIFNVKGSLLKSETLIQNQQEINISNLSTGTYIIKIKSENFTGKQKLIIQR